MPVNEIPRYVSPEMRSLIESALEDAWQELERDGPADVRLGTAEVNRDDYRSRVGW